MIGSGGGGGLRRLGVDSSAMSVAEEIHFAGAFRAALTQVIAALPDEQRELVVLPWDHPGRTRWDSGPRERSLGMRWSAIAPTARPLIEMVLSLLHSPNGHQRMWAIRSLESILGRLEGGRPHRDPDRYWIQIFGDPSHGPSTFRFEGHHLSVNATVIDDRVRATPLFRATNPARVPDDDPRAGWRVLDREEDCARTAIAALPATQRQRAWINAPLAGDTQTGVAESLLPTALAPQGISLLELPLAATAAIHAAVDAWLDHLTPVLAADLRQRNRGRGGWFAWQGDARGAFAWRCVEGDLLIDVNQAQNAGNHIHAVVRECGQDWASS